MQVPKTNINWYTVYLSPFSQDHYIEVLAIMKVLSLPMMSQSLKWKDVLQKRSRFICYLYSIEHIFCYRFHEFLKKNLKTRYKMLILGLPEGTNVLWSDCEIALNSSAFKKNLLWRGNGHIRWSLVHLLSTLLPVTCSLLMLLKNTYNATLTFSSCFWT